MTIDATTLKEFFQLKERIDFSKLDDDTPLFTSGIVQSFTMIELVFFIEERCATKLHPSEVRLGNLDSIAQILAFVSGRSTSTHEA